MSYIWQTWPSFRFSNSNLAKGQPKQGKLYFAKIFSAWENFKISARGVFLVNMSFFRPSIIQVYFFITSGIKSKISEAKTPSPYFLAANSPALPLIKAAA